MAIKFETKLKLQVILRGLVTLFHSPSQNKKKNTNSRRVMEEIKKRKTKELEDYLFLSRYGGL